MQCTENIKTYHQASSISGSPIKNFLAIINHDNKGLIIIAYPQKSFVWFNETKDIKN